MNKEKELTDDELKNMVDEDLGEDEGDKSEEGFGLEDLDDDSDSGFDDEEDEDEEEDEE